LSTTKQIYQCLGYRLGESETETADHEEYGGRDDPVSSAILGQGRVGYRSNQRLSDQARDGSSKPDEGGELLR
jgi:hypothetical protein